MKLENILLDSNNNVKIADFGWAVHTKSQRKRETLCGTVQCEKFKLIFQWKWENILDLAPEILNSEGYDESLDLWCLGIITFELLFAKSPFESLHNEGPEAVLDRISIVDFQFIDDENVKISEFAQDFIKKVFFSI